MRIVVAGAHGQIARRLGRLLSARGDTVVGLIRNPDHAADLRERRRRARRPRPGDRPRSTSVADVRPRRRRRRVRRRCRAGQRCGPQAHRRPRRRRAAGRRRRAGRRRARYLLVSSMGVEQAPRRHAAGHGPGLRAPTCRRSSPPRTTSCPARPWRTTVAAARAGSPTSPGTGRVHARPRHRATAASPGTTSRRCSSRCSTPGADGVVVELVGGDDPDRRGGRRGWTDRQLW